MYSDDLLQVQHSSPGATSSSGGRGDTELYICKFRAPIHLPRTTVMAKWWTSNNAPEARFKESNGRLKTVK